ncbi:MAG: hypothetical protein ACHQ4H_12650 [Ktedonobacterales bacterium]
MLQRFRGVPGQRAMQLCKREVTRLMMVLGTATMLLGASWGTAAHASAPATSTLHGSTVTVNVPGKTPEIHDAQWYSLKLAHRVVAPGVISSPPVPECIAPCDYYKLLSTSVVTNTVEALGYGPDDNGDGYTDSYLWNFCGAGAADNALYYWNGKTNTYPAGWYTEPSSANYHTNTYWNSSDHNRSYEMYLADKVMVPGWAYPGMVTFKSYSSAGTYLGDLTNTLNWEASGHSSSWQNYFYLSVPNWYKDSSGKYTIKVSKSTVNSDIVADINGGHAVVVEVNTTNLPNWNRNGLTHYITIVGYDNTTGIYWYTDTCGTACGSMYNGGVHTINQVTPDQYGNDLYDAIINVGVGGGFSW